MTVYFLDRNVVNLVKTVATSSDYSQLIKKGDKKTTQRNLEMIRNLKRQDKMKNIHTCVLSIIEGETGKPQNDVDLKKVAEKEIQSLSSFFKKSKTDIGVLPFIQRNSGLFPNGLWEESADSVCSFLEFISSQIFQPVSSKKLSSVRDDILEKAFCLNVDLKHPSVILSLAALYGCEYAWRVIKPSKKKFNKYNAYNDIMTPFRISELTSKEVDDWCFLTLDVDLSYYVKKNVFFLSSAREVSFSPYLNNRVNKSFSYGVDIQMFEKLDDNERSELLQIIESPYKHLGLKKRL
ncbi:hypothetical protein [Thalassospira povalilytica]|uniref:Uncharacterized protein n=1 Tax=Thalassospira povalilytica TaxID=732237 RepID=A0A8I1M4S3_9PROT|nr:hypothetical protein [Thalassospira povalilytica]MBN8194969.1 hypothetical protein [Thalassospira povalilytica]